MAWQTQQMPQQQMQQMPQQQMQQMPHQQQMQHQQQMVHQQQMQPQQQMQHQQHPQMQHQMQAKGMGQGKAGKAAGKGGKGNVQGVMPRPPVQNQVRPQMPQPAANGTITVSGCNNATVSNIITGTYSVSGNNHGKPIYKKENSPPNVTVLIYYWDERDGPDFSGWWFGPKVGGDQVWSHADDRTSPQPPVAGWHVPWDGALDPMLKLTYAAAAGPGGTPAGTPGASPAPPRPAPPKGHVVGARPQMKQNIDIQAHRQEMERRKQEAAPQAQAARMEEMKKKQAADLEAQRKRQEDIKRSREEEAQKRKEQIAATSVRKVLQKVRAARPESYDSLRVQLEDAISTHLEAMGSMASKVGLEAEQALQAAQKRIDDFNQQRSQEEKRRAEEEKQRRYDAEHSTQLIEQAKADAEARQGRVQEVEDMVKRLDEEEDPTKSLELAEAAEMKIGTVLEEATLAQKSITEKQRGLGDGARVGKVHRELSEIISRLSLHIRSLSMTLRSLRSRRDKVARKAAAAKKIKEKKLIFSKFDADKDGKLDKKEVEAYMKATINFDLPPDVLDGIVSKLNPITFAKFKSLHQRLYIAKSELLAREARAAEEARRIAPEENGDSLMSDTRPAEPG